MAMLKAALISMVPSFGAVVPNVIVFQTNPESIVHTVSAAASNQTEDAEGGDQHVPFSPIASSGQPNETFSFTLILDANDDIADVAINPVAASIASSSGVYSRLAALELLQFTVPSSQTLVGQVSSAAINAGTSSPSTGTTVAESDVPVALFVWGASRILPVRVRSLTATEKLYDELLNPSHVEVQVTLNVLTPQELNAVQSPLKDIAMTAYSYTQSIRQSQAVANLGGAGAASILGMLPAPL